MRTCGNGVAVRTCSRRKSQSISRITVLKFCPSNRIDGSLLLIDPYVVDVELADKRLAREDGVHVAFPVGVDHQIQDDLHGTILDRGGVGEFAALHAVDVPSEMIWLPV